MKTKRVLRYYCDHCGRGRCSKQSTWKHEQRCIRNPNRLCGFCHTMQKTAKPVAELRAAFTIAGDVDAVRELCGNCPACILATIVQSRIQEPDEDGRRWVDFDYKAEVKAFWERFAPPESAEISF